MGVMPIEQRADVPELGPIDAIVSVPLASLAATLGLGDCETAALVSNLDLVISIDTAVAHLAGALGIPVWTLIGHPPEWRWLQDRSDSPWYPTMRLFRQGAGEGWEPVIARMADALGELSQGRGKRG